MNPVILRDAQLKRVTFDIGKRRATFTLEVYLSSDIVAKERQYAMLAGSDAFLNVAIMPIQEPLPLDDDTEALSDNDVKVIRFAGDAIRRAQPGVVSGQTNA